MKEADDYREMSEQLSESMQAAAAETIGSSGGIMTGMVAMISYLDEDGDRSWAVAFGDQQGAPLSLGMAKTLELYCEEELKGRMFERGEME